MTLTLGILMFTIFLLGFIADPIINLYVDPLDTFYYTEFWQPSALADGLPSGRKTAWLEHLVKGLASLGVLSFIKVVFAFSPWWSMRSSGVFSSGRSTGRNRVASIGWLVILIGVGSFLWAVYKGVRTWSGKTLEKAGERVMDVPLPDDDDAGETSDGDQGHSKKDD
ncbi:RING finger [Aspergillus sp. HF37]|nr:RING finger [Aspergillus sp. HF37]